MTVWFRPGRSGAAFTFRISVGNGEASFPSARQPASSIIMRLRRVQRHMWNVCVCVCGWELQYNSQRDGITQ